MWVYCGGRTTETVVNEIGKEYKGELVGYETLEEVIGEEKSFEGLKGIIVTDMSLSTLLNYREIREVSKKFEGVRVVSLTTREDVPEKDTLPNNLEIVQDDKVRVAKLVEILTGG